MTLPRLRCPPVSPVHEDVGISPDGRGEVGVLTQRQAVVAPPLLLDAPRGEVLRLLHGRGRDVPQQEVHRPVTGVHALVQTVRQRLVALNNITI